MKATELKYKCYIRIYFPLSQEMFWHWINTKSTDSKKFEEFHRILDGAEISHRFLAALIPEISCFSGVQGIWIFLFFFLSFSFSVD